MWTERAAIICGLELSPAIQVRNQGAIQVSLSLSCFQQNLPRGKMVCAFERKYGFLGEQGALQNTAFRIWFSNERLSFALFPKNCPQTMTQTMFLLGKVKRDCFCWKHKLTSTQDGG